jgi:membrane protease YdiL (CAAX protease family)
MAYFLTQLPLLASLGAVLLIVFLFGRASKLAPLFPVFQSPKKEALIALIPLAILGAFVVFMAVMVWKPGDASAEPGSYTFGQALQQLIANLIILLPFAAVVGIRRQGLETIGLSRHSLLPSLLVGLIASGVTMVIYRYPISALWMKPGEIYRLVAQLGVGISEEAIFRGFLQTRFTAWMGARRAEIITAVTFALFHIPQRIAHGIAGASLAVDLLVLLAWGLVFGWAMRKMGNIAGLSLLHAVFNLVG